MAVTPRSARFDSSQGDWRGVGFRDSDRGSTRKSSTPPQANSLGFESLLEVPHCLTPSCRHPENPCELYSMLGIVGPCLGYAQDFPFRRCMYHGPDQRPYEGSSESLCFTMYHTLPQFRHGIWTNQLFCGPRRPQGTHGSCS